MRRKSMFDHYYKSAFTPEEIREEIRLLSQSDPQGAKLREKLYDYRFYTQKYGKDTVICDRFLAFWVNTQYYSKTIEKSRFRLRLARKNLVNALSDKKLSGVFDGKWPDERVIYEQLYGAARRYLFSCQSDKTYSSLMFGFVSLKPAQLTEKMLADFADAFLCFLWRCGFFGDFPIVCKAAYDAWMDVAPDTESALWRRIEKTGGPETVAGIRALLSDK